MSLDEHSFGSVMRWKYNKKRHWNEINKIAHNFCSFSTFVGEWNNGEDNQLRASTKQGSITVAVQSWFESLKLNK